MKQRRSLGKGLSELGISELLSGIQQQETVERQGLSKIAIELIEPGRFQPRQEIKPEALEELVASIRAQGVIQPIIVRKTRTSNYELIAGERRWRPISIMS